MCTLCRMLLLFLFLFSLQFFCGCSTSNVSRHPLEFHKPKSENSNILVYSESQKAPDNVKIIGMVDVTDGSFITVCSYTEMVSAFVREAKAMGGQALKITNVKHSGYHSSCYIGSANVLRFLNKEESLKEKDEKQEEKKSNSGIIDKKKTKRPVYVAVVETISNGVVQPNEKMYLTNVLREEAVSIMPSDLNYVIMTSENIQSMLPPGQNIEECEGSCLVETGRNIAADYIAQARISTFGQKITITVELYSSSSGKLISSFNAKSSDIEGLEAEIRKRSLPLFKEILRIESNN